MIKSFILNSRLFCNHSQLKAYLLLTITNKYSEKTFDMRINFINKAGIPLAMIGLPDALPGTQLFKRPEREKRLIKISNGNNTHDILSRKWI